MPEGEAEAEAETKAPAAEEEAPAAEAEAATVDSEAVVASVAVGMGAKEAAALQIQYACMGIMKGAFRTTTRRSTIGVCVCGIIIALSGCSLQHFPAVFVVSCQAR